MALIVSLLCDACGHRSPAEAKCRDRAARGAIADAGIARGWVRHKVNKYGEHIDLCPSCAKKIKRPARLRKTKPKLVGAPEGIVIPFPAKGGRGAHEKPPATHRRSME